MNGDARVMSLLASSTQLTSYNNKQKTALASTATLGYGEIFKILFDQGSDITHNRKILRTIIIIIIYSIFIAPFSIKTNVQRGSHTRLTQGN